MILKVKVTANSSKNEIIGWIDDWLKIKIAAPPQKGKANQELIKFLSKEWNIPKRVFNINKGFKKRNKLIEIRGVGSIPIAKPPQFSIEL